MSSGYAEDRRLSVITAQTFNSDQGYDSEDRLHQSIASVSICSNRIKMFSASGSPYKLTRDVTHLNQDPCKRPRYNDLNLVDHSSGWTGITSTRLISIRSIPIVH